MLWERPGESVAVLSRRRARSFVIASNRSSRMIRLALRRRGLAIMLAIVIGLHGNLPAAAVAPGSPACAELEAFLAQIDDSGYRAALTVDVEEDPDRPPTREDFLAAAELIRTYLAELQSLDPPPIAQTYYALLVEGAGTIAQMVDVMALIGFLGVLGHEEAVDDLRARIAMEALALEQQCELAISDHDGDGIDEIGAGDSAIVISPQATGARGAPFPIGATVRYHDTWEVTVLGVTPNGTEAILARSELNDPPAGGEHYVIVTLRVTNLGDDIDSFDLERLRALGPSTISYGQFDDDCGLVPDPLIARDLPPGTSAEGNICWSIRSEDLNALVMYTNGVPPDERVYLALTDSGSRDAATPVSKLRRQTIGRQAAGKE